jgi:putative ABC transport system permease protein
METLAFDLRDAFRSFRRDRGYASIVIVTLALTIGATTAVFSIVDGVLLKPLAYADAERLVALREIWQEFVSRVPTLEVNERHFEYWQQHTASFDALAQYVVRPANLTGVGDATQIAIVRCSGALFDVLQVQASIGRTLASSDDPADAPDVVVITDAFWRQRFGARSDVVGTSMVIDGTPRTIVGVIPPDFRLPSGRQLTAAFDAFVPLRVQVGWVGDHNNEAIGRLRRGVTMDQARAELDVLQAQVSKMARGEARDPVTLSASVTGLSDYVVGRSRRGLLLLLGAIAAVLLIACSNLANLSLTRTIGRLREAAIRAALGASRARLLGRALLEQLLLAIAGGAVGLWVAWAALALFVRTAPLDLPRVHEVALDGRVLVFALLVSVFAGIFTAVVPAWRLAGRDVQATLRASAASVTSHRGGLRAHATLLALQVGLSVTLLVAAGLFGASLMRVLNIDRGFTADRVWAVDLSLPPTRYADEPTRQTVYDRLLAAVHALPGVQRVATTSMLPMRGQGQTNFIAKEGSTAPMSELPSANFRFVAPEFFSTLGIALQRGRSFTDAERDPNRPAPVVISEPTAARLWPGEDPVGKRLSRGIPREQGFEVVGVAADARVTSLDVTPPLMVYVPYWWRSRAALSLLIQTASDRLAILPDVRRAVREIDPEIALGEARPLQQLVDRSLAGRRYQTQLFVAFGVVALFIATVGVYAATAYGVSRRRREMNLRVALGARSSQVLALILRQGTTPVIAGVVAGAAGALAAGGLLSGLLFEVRARDPLVLGAVIALVAAVSLVTCGLVARRGLTLDPSAALREE